MKKLTLLIALAFCTLLSGCSLNKNAQAGIQVRSDQSVNVFINGESKGVSPISIDNLTPGSYEVKLQSDQGELTKQVRIEEGTLFFINYNLAATPEQQEGEMIYLESNGRGAGIISNPSEAEVTLDGQKQGFTPYLIQNLSEGEHELVLAKDGYKSKVVKINSVNNYKIMVEAQLKSLSQIELSNSPTPEPTTTPNASTTASPKASATSAASATSKPSPKLTAIPKASSTAKASPSAKPSASTSSSKAKGTVTVLDTGTGWLKVRNQAGLNGTELTRVNTGDKLEYIDQTDTGWTQVILEDGTTGYVASRFVKINN